MLIFYASVCVCIFFFHFCFVSLLQKLSLIHVNSNQCLDKASEDDSQVPSVKDYTGGRSQQWLLRNVTLPEIFWDRTRMDRWTDSHSDADGERAWERKDCFPLNPGGLPSKWSKRTEPHMYMNLPITPPCRGKKKKRTRERKTCGEINLSLMPLSSSSEERWTFWLCLRERLPFRVSMCACLCVCVIGMCESQCFPQEVFFI